MLNQEFKTVNPQKLSKKRNSHTYKKVEKIECLDVAFCVSEGDQDWDQEEWDNTMENNYGQEDPGDLGKI